MVLGSYQRNPAWPWVLGALVVTGVVVGAVVVVRARRAGTPLPAWVPGAPVAGTSAQSVLVEEGVFRQLVLSPEAAAGKSGMGQELSASWWVQRDQDGTYSAYGKRGGKTGSSAIFREAHGLPSVQVAKTTAVTFAGEALQHDINEFLASHPGWKLQAAAA